MTARTLIAGGVLAAALSGAIVASAVQPVEPMVPEAQQEIEILRPQGVQALSDVEVPAEQDVGVPQPVSRGVRAASTVGKVVLGVLAAGVAIGAMAASLLLL